MNIIPNTPITIPVGELRAARVGLGKVLPKHSTLPVLGCVHVQRDADGWTTLSVSDLERAVTLRLEAPARAGRPATVLVPFSDLQRLAKICLADETLELEAIGNDDEPHVVLRHRLGSQAVGEKVTSFPVTDYPPLPEFTARPAMLEEAAKATLLSALSCASDDPTRTIIQGAYLDTTDPASHHVVATDGRCLFSANSVSLPVPASVLIPAHRFLTWGGFAKDGPWELTVQEPKKRTSDSGVIRLESRRWTFITRQTEGTYPNWRNITKDNERFAVTLNLSAAAAGELSGLVPRLPGANTPTRSVGLKVQAGKLLIRGRHREADRWTELEVSAPVAINGTAPAAPVYVNRDYLLQALDLGLLEIGIQEPLRPVRFSNGGGHHRQLIVMPVRVEEHDNDPTPVPASTPPPVTATITTPANGNTDHGPAVPVNPAADDQPSPTNHHQPERNITPMLNGNTTSTPNRHVNGSVNSNNGNGIPNADDQEARERHTVEGALEQIESIKGAIRASVSNLNALADSLRQIQRERKQNEREVRNVRETLRSLQTVRL